jgi:hypothetical protein
VRAVCDRRAQRADRSLTITSITCVALNDAQVEVSITARIDYIFVKVVPGAPRTATVHAHAIATASPPANQTP